MTPSTRQSNSASAPPLAASRSCGGCNVCCTAMHVRSLNKPAGTPCVHQSPAGCGNYAHRPEVCRVWYCMWVRDPRKVFTDDQRPDKLGVFFTAAAPDASTGKQSIFAHEVTPAASDSPAAASAIAFLRQFTEVQILPFKPPVAAAPGSATTPLTIAGRAVA